ncbi:MAG: diaminopimelate decarboxylase [Hyphomicrobiaceae bacterium]
MHHFAYRNGTLHAESVSLEGIATEVGTPVYVYSTATLLRHYQVFEEAFAGQRAHVFYAMKANSNLAVLQTLARAGAGADTVSEGEIRKALAAGIPAGKIVFSGVGKSDQELAFAVATGIYQVNIETEDELHALSRIAAAQGKRQAAVFRVNPDVGAGANAKITTGGAENKFGISLGEVGRLYDVAANLSGVRLMGLAVHIGSQIRTVAEFAPAFARIRDLVVGLQKRGHRVERADLGGGLGIPYEMAEAETHGPDLIQAYAAMVQATFKGLDVELGFEPGRLIVGNAGILLTRVLRQNARDDRLFAVVDAAMNDLARPAMYESFHDLMTVRDTAKGAPRLATELVGPICESSDTFMPEGPRSLPPLQPGDLVALMTAGAYGASMSSTYNTRLLVPEVLVNGDQFAVVRPRQTYAELLGLDRKAPWL